MPETGSSKLYTPDVLALAVSLAAYPLAPDLPLRGEARARACGSTLDLGLALDDDRRISRVGLAVRACAIGQAAAALFAASAAGRTAVGIEQSVAAIEAWLGGDGPDPDWPGFAVLAGAQAYPARHGAILLPWKAAQAALGKPHDAG